MKTKSKIKLLAGAFISGATIGFAASSIAKRYLRKFLHKESITSKNGKPLTNRASLDEYLNSPEYILSQVFYSSTKNSVISIKNRSGENIGALHYENPEWNGKYAILCHGYRASVKSQMVYARHFYEAGYNLLLPYMRAHEGSEHSWCTMGWRERFDIIDWAEYITNQKGCSKIVLHGTSMGAAAVMMATGEDLPSSVICAIEDCGFSSAYAAYEFQIPRVMHLPAFPILDIFNSLVKRELEVDFKKVSAVEQLKKSKTPTLFIHGTADSVVPFYMLDEIYSAAACEKEKLICAKADHMMCASKYPEIYWNRIFEFIKKHEK